MIREAEENKEADAKRKGDIEVKNKAQTYIDQINQTLVEQGDKITQEQKDELIKIRDEAQGAMGANDIEKLREIVGRLEDTAAKAAQYAQQTGANPNPGAGAESQQTGADDVVDADFTDKKN